jgi:hypothetical protein
LKLINEVGAAMGLFRTERGEEMMAAALIVRQRFAIGERGALTLLPGDEGAAIRMDAVDEGDYGSLEGDGLLPRTGTDVMVLGDAISKEATVATRVEVHVADYHVKLDVFGDRVWESVMGALIPSQPAPFVKMPVTLGNAFGGQADGEYGPIPWPQNPSGKGYYIDSGQAKGQPLPNIEWSNARVKHWDDRPDPVAVGPYPSMWGLRLLKAVTPDEANESFHVDLSTGLCDRAHPVLSGKPVMPGPMKILGMTPSGFLEFDVPVCPFQIEIAIGGPPVSRELDLEEILVDLRTESGKSPSVEFSYRKMFRYPLFAHQKRSVRVFSRRAA